MWILFLITVLACLSPAWALVWLVEVKLCRGR